MKQKLATAALFTVAFILHPSSFVFGQGSLTPPGTPAPTMKTLDQIEPRTPISALPFTISQPGSYYLAGSLQFSVAGGNAITITASDVTLDLMGHTLSSTAGVTGDAIRINPSLSNIAVMNGIIAGNTTVSGDATSAGGLTITLGGFSNGVNSFSSPEPTGCRFSNLTVTGCRVIGLDAGTQALVEQVTVSQNGSEGIDAASGVITHATALLNGNAGGIVMSSGGTISHSTSNSNNGVGLSANSSTVINCNAATNRTQGIDASNGSVINCVASSNRGTGIQVDGGSVADSTAISNQGSGIDATNGSVSNCVASGNVGTNIIAPGPIPIDSLPFTISQSGSYYLSRNLQFTATSGHAITITTSDVTLDLRGHTLSATAAVTGDGIRIDPLGANNVAVINGNVSGGGGFDVGVHAVNGPVPHGLRYSHLSIRGCRSFGLDAGEGAVIEDITVTGNGAGIKCGASSVSRCAAYLNSGTGISASSCAITDCQAWNNDGTGISATSPSSVTNCQASFNGDDGIFAPSGVVAFCEANINNQNANGSVDIDATGATRTGNKPTP